MAQSTTKKKISDLLVLNEIAGRNGDIVSSSEVTEANYTKKGTTIKMGIGGNQVHKFLENKYIAVMYIVNREEFFKTKEELKNQQ